jgi:hypothetical protein
MATNDEIKEKYEEKRTFGGEHSYEEVDAIFDDKIDIALDEARADENTKYIRTGQGNDELGHYELFRKYKVD